MIRKLFLFKNHKDSFFLVGFWEHHFEVYYNLLGPNEHGQLNKQRYIESTKTLQRLSTA